LAQRSGRKVLTSDAMIARHRVRGLVNGAAPEIEVNGHQVTCCGGPTQQFTSHRTRFSDVPKSAAQSHC
jgi:hypothetical protein